jgi:tetratricopeptide (TPR) repeat protein
MSEHYDAQSAATLLASDDAEGRDHLRQHARACSECRRLLDGIETAARPPRRALPQRLRAAIGEVSPDLGAEDAVARLLAAGERFDAVASTLPKTLAVARAIAAAARDEIERDVTRAIQLVDVAIEMTANLGGVDKDLIALARSRALKEKALALRQAARHEDALVTLDAADDALLDLSVSEYDHAVIDLVRATIFGEIERLDESVAIAQRLEPIFAAYGDERMTNLCRFHLANIAARRGDWPEAYRVYTKIAASDGIDPVTRAQVEQNAGQAAAEFGDTPSAVAHLEIAGRMFESLAMPSEVARCEWVTGRVAINDGRQSRAIEILEPVRRAFLRLSLVEEAGLTALDITRSLLSVGSVDEARSLCFRVIEEFEGAGLSRRAIEALKMLHDHIDAANDGDVDSISDFIGALRTDPEVAMPMNIFRHG